MIDSSGSATLLQREPAHRVSPRARTMWRTTEAFIAVIALAAVIFVYTRDWIPSPWYTLLVALVVVEALITIPVVPWWRYRVHLWEVTADAVYTQRGWLNQERRVAPISRIQTVDTERGPIARMFGLSSVTITTASAKGELRIDGLDRHDADRLAEELTRIAAADGGDGT